MAEPRVVSVAIECDGTVADLLDLLKRRAPALKLAIPGFYISGVVDPKTVTFCTAVVAVDDLVDLLPLVKRLELGSAIVSAHPVLPAVEPWSLPPAKSPNTVIGIVDDFVGFADRRLASGKSSRVKYIWSQDPTAPREGAGWKNLAPLSYGFELDTSGKSLDELRQAYPAQLRRATHGAHIAHLATSAPEPEDLAATLADVIAVHLPKRTLADSSGGALNVQALDAVRYIVQRAGTKAPVVVNLSYGTMAGPARWQFDPRIRPRRTDRTPWRQARDRCSCWQCLRAKVSRRAGFRWRRATP